MFGLTVRQISCPPASLVDRNRLYEVTLNGGPWDGHRFVSPDEPAERLQFKLPEPALRMLARPDAQLNLLYEMCHSTRPIGRPVVQYCYEFRGYLSTLPTPASTPRRSLAERARQRGAELLREVKAVVRWFLGGAKALAR